MQRASPVILGERSSTREPGKTLSNLLGPRIALRASEDDGEKVLATKMTERFTPFTRADLDARQKEVFDDIASGPRGTVPSIFHLYLNSPELASRVQQLGAFCRYGTSLPPRLSELAILIVAHHWKAEYEWSIHTGEARKAGLSDDVIVAIGADRRPAFGDPDAELVYDFATEFFRANNVPDALFASAVERLGRATTVELAGILGYYSMLAIAIRIFRLPPEG